MLQKLISVLSLAALIAAQSLGPTYNLSTVLSQQDQLTTFASYLDQFPELLALVAPGNFTLLAPSNAAFTKSFNSTNATSINADKLEAILSYHALNGSLTQAQFNENPQFIPTLLSNPRYANVTGGQRVEAVSMGGGVLFYSALKAVSHLVTADILYYGSATGVIHVIDSLLIPPLSEPDTVTGAKLNGFVKILVETPPSPEILGVVGPSPDWTIFAPNSTTVSLVNKSLDAIYAYEDYHFVQGEVAYSSDLTNGKKLKTVQGHDVTITLLNGSIYVNDQKVISPNYLISTGVLHLIESNLNPNETSARPDSNNTSLVPTPSSTKSSLSTGAKAGIGIGAAVAVLCVAVLLWFCVRRHRRRTSSSPHRPETGSKSEFTAPRHELDSKASGMRHEKDGQQGMRLEKDGQQVWAPPAELEGNHAS